MLTVAHRDALVTTETLPLEIKEALSVHQVFRWKSYKVPMVFDFQVFTFSSLSIEQNERWLLSQGLEPAELGTGAHAQHQAGAAESRG